MGQLLSSPWLDILIMRLIASDCIGELIELQLGSQYGERGGDLAGMQHAHRVVSHAARWQVCRSRKGYLLVAGIIRIVHKRRYVYIGVTTRKWLWYKEEKARRLQCTIKEGNDFSRTNKNKKKKKEEKRRQAGRRTYSHSFGLVQWPCCSSQPRRHRAVTKKKTINKMMYPSHRDGLFAKRSFQ